MSEYGRINPRDLDNHITGHYGEDQFSEVESKHTPGPREPHADEFEMDQHGKIRDTMTGEIYGSVPIALRSLYNAAPDLLAALERLVYFHDTNDTPNSDPWTQARAALAKAKQ